MKIIYIVLISLLLIQCKPDVQEWKFENEIDLGNVTPIGMAVLGNHIWISDGDHNQMVHLDKSGNVLGTFQNFERPMHIDADNNKLYVPEYGKDQITIFSPDNRIALSIPDSLDAPAGVDVNNNEYVIADFYNHRLLYSNGESTISIGNKGKKDGEFHYPTDVQLTQDQIYVADAYNNRIQVFDKQGSHIRSFGKDEKMNAATGIYVSDEEVFVTDFENDRVVIYSKEGNLNQTLNVGLEKPTDIIMIDGKIYVANYKGKNIRIYQKR